MSIVYKSVFCAKCKFSHRKACILLEVMVLILQKLKTVLSLTDSEVGVHLFSQGNKQ